MASRGLLLLVPWALQCPWQVRCSCPPTIARRGCTDSPCVLSKRRSTSEVSKGNVLGYYRNLGSLKYGNEYCVPCRAMALYDSVIASVDVNLRILWRSGRLYSQTPRPFWQALARFGGYHRHRLVQHRCRAIGSFLQHCTNQCPCSNTALLKKASVIREKGVFPICVLYKKCRTRSHISGNRGYDSNRVQFHCPLCSNVDEWLHIDVCTHCQSCVRSLPSCFSGGG